MRKTLRRLFRTLFVLGAVIVALTIWKREELTRLMAVNSLFSAEKIVTNFSHMDEAFLTVEMPRGDGPISALPAGTPMQMPSGYDQWVKDRSVTAVVVLKNGQLVHDAYYQGTQPEDLRISWSMAKSYLSALFGIVMAEGAIADLNDPVVKYAPSLKGSAYENDSILNVLQMSSGVKFNEDYLDFNSDINRMGRVLALGQSMDDFTEKLHETDNLPGTVWHYVSIDTHVLGMVIRGATGRSIPDLMSEKVLRPMGLEAGAKYITDGYGTAFVLGGLNLRTRDYARMGQMYLQGGEWNGRQIVPEKWVVASTQPSAKTEPGEYQYGYQWWMPSDARVGEYLARGIYGQYVYVDWQSGTVVAVNSADRKFREDGVEDENVAMFRAIAMIK